MTRPRITIAGMLGIVALTAVAFASLREPTEAWDSGLFGVTLMTMLISALLVVHRSGARRAYWLGFALFGWAYLGLTLVPPVEARLPSSRVLVLGWEMVARSEDSDDYLAFTTPPGNVVVPAASSSPANTGPPGRWDVVVYNYPGTPAPTSYIKRLVGLPGETAGNFVRIGHSLFALALAFVGGMISRRLHQRPLATGRTSDTAFLDVGGPGDLDGPRTTTGTG